jgi:hypothetical protein
VAVDDTLSTTEDNPNSVNVLTNDTDVENDPRTVTGFTQGAHGTVSCTAVGVCTYTPAANYNGPDSFDYTVTDSNLGSDTGTVSVTVSAVNDPPVAVDDTLTTNEDTASSVNVLTNDLEVDGDPKTVTAFTQGAHGTVSCTTAGVCTYTPTANYFGPDTFDYTLSDGITTDIGTVTVTVNSINDNPVAVDDTLTTNEDAANSVNVLTNDTDVENDARTVTAFTQGAHGTVSCTVAGVCTYTPAANYHGPDTFDYTVTDSNGGSDTGTVSVTVTSINDAPVAVDDTLTTNEDTAGGVNVVANDIDVDGDTRTVTAFTQGAHGVVNCTVAGICTYTPAANYFGPDTFDYTVSDGALTDTGTVNVTVTAVNDNPVAVDDSLTTNEDTAGSVNVLTNDTDVESNPLSVTGFTQAAHGAVNCTPAGSCTYTPFTNYHGPDQFTYTVGDGNGGSAVGTVHVTVTSVNDLPFAVNDSYFMFTGETLNVNTPGVLGNDGDPDGDTLVAQLGTPPASGTFAFDGTGSFSYIPAAGFTGDVTFTYRAFDGTAQSNLATVTITVSEPPPAGPSAAVFGSQTICEGSTATITALLTGNGPWTITWSDGVTETTASSSITRTVKPSTTTIYTITAVSDADGSGNATGSAVITVTPLPAAPSITAPASIVLGQPLTLTASNGYLAYQWYLNGAPIPGATGATYSVAAVTLADLGTYTVTGARGGCSSLPSAATTIDTEVIDAILAVVGATPGANGSRFDTTLSLFNPTSIEMKGTIQLLFGGETRITETRNITYDVKPLSTVYLSNFLEGVSGLASANLVRTEGGTPMALAHVFNDAGARGTFGMLQRARVMSDVLVRGDEAILIAPANVVTTRFNVGVRALREGATVRIVVRDSDGAILMTVNRSYAPSALTQQSASELIGRPIGASDTLSFSIVEGRAVIYGAATDNATNDPNLQFASRVQQASGNTYVIAVAGSTQGAFGSLFRTGVQLHNPNESPMSARFVLHPTGRSGSDGDPSMPITVGAHRTTSIADLLPAMSQTGLGSVDLVVESVLRPIASVRVFNDASDRQTSMTEDLATTSDAIKAGETASIIAPHDPAAARFNVGVRTLGSGARINATVRASDGTLVTTKTLDYPATFFVQSGAPDLLGVTLHGGESVMFEVVSGSALIYGVWTDNLTQDPSFHFAARK